MSAFAYIEMPDVPAGLREGSMQRKDTESAATLISFEGCPLTGELRTVRSAFSDGPVDQVEYPFPRNAQIRNDLVAWFVNHGINFTVVM